MSVMTFPATWAQRYAGDSTQMPDPGVSQGVLDRDSMGDPLLVDGRGHERSLVGFDLTSLPAGVELLAVQLQVPWAHWYYGNNLGDLVLGWHDQASAPATWTVGAGTAQRAPYEVWQGPVDLYLSWVIAALSTGSFKGLAVGPGLNDGALYAGSTDAALSDWALVVTYLAR
jgi:hypothetical protein